jgi:plastocyanin
LKTSATGATLASRKTAQEFGLTDERKGGTQMSNYKWYLGFAAIMMTAGCSNLPQTTQTGEVRDVKIESTVSPEKVTVRPGDEVRWINHRKGNVTLILQDTKSERISCNRGFTNEGTTVIGPNQTASICFNKAGEVKYNVRMESMLPGGEEPAKGEIQVE